MVVKNFFLIILGCLACIVAGCGEDKKNDYSYDSFLLEKLNQDIKKIQHGLILLNPYSEKTFSLAKKVNGTVSPEEAVDCIDKMFHSGAASEEWGVCLKYLCFYTYQKCFSEVQQARILVDSNLVSKKYVLEKTVISLDDGSKVNAYTHFKYWKNICDTTYNTLSSDKYNEYINFSTDTSFKSEEEFNMFFDIYIKSDRV